MDDHLDRTLGAFGPRLKNLRLRRGITLTDLAEETGISTSTLSRLEAGLRRPTLEQLLPIACSDGSTILPLTRRPGGIQAYKFILPAGDDNRAPDLRTHEGYDWVYVLNGTLRLVLGEHTLLLHPGEAAEFDTRTPHWFGSTSSGPVEYLSLIGKQGERAHVRAAPRRSLDRPRSGDA